jgi:hypothetical protein
MGSVMRTATLATVSLMGLIAPWSVGHAQAPAGRPVQCSFELRCVEHKPGGGKKDLGRPTLTTLLGHPGSYFSEEPAPAANGGAVRCEGLGFTVKVDPTKEDAQGRGVWVKAEAVLTAPDPTDPTRAAPLGKVRSEKLVRNGDTIALDLKVRNGRRVVVEIKFGLIK